jgi:hypothetical protein
MFPLKLYSVLIIENISCFYNFFTFFTKYIFITYTKEVKRLDKQKNVKIVIKLREYFMEI